MLVVHRRGGVDRELDLEIDRSTATVADLLGLLGEAGALLVVDGVVVHAELSLVETPLVQGSVVASPASGLSLCPGPGPGPGSGRRGPGAGGAGERTGGGNRRPVTRPVTTVVSVAGMGAGRRLPLGAGTWLVGRHPGADLVVDSPTVSARHAGLRIDGDGAVEVRDVGSANGTWLGPQAVTDVWTPVPDGVLVRLGAVVVRFERRPPADRAGALDPVRHADANGRVTLDRPPRPPAPAPGEPLRVPEPPRVDRHHPGLVLLPALLPAVGGLATLAVTGNWLFALVPLLSPIIALAGWWQGRRRAGRAGRREEARFRHELTDFAAGLAATAEAEVVRRSALHPDLGEVVRRAESSSSRLWERRPEDADWLALTVGLGSVPWPAPLTQLPDPVPAALAEVLTEAALLPLAPAVVDVAGGGVLGVVGPAPLARAVARSLVLQAAVHHGPADLSVVVLASADAARSWTWCRWLPHTADSAPPADGSTGGTAAGIDQAPVRVGRESSVSLLRRLLAEAQRRRNTGRADRTDRPVEGPTRLVVVDDEQLLRGPRAPARAVLRGEAGPVAGIVLAPTADRLPASCTAVLELRGADGRAVLRPVGTGPVMPTLHLLAAGLAEADARRTARVLARFQDGEQADGTGGLARCVRLRDLLGLPHVHGVASPPSSPRLRVAPSSSVEAEEAAGVAEAAETAEVDEVLSRWQSSAGLRSLAVPLGRSAEGPVVVDLVSDGPHALVAGTTGAGKSELLRTWVAALATQFDPRRLTFILIDYKGGSAFDDCAHLPHTAAVVTDLDDALAARALRCLEAEIRYREEVLRRAGVTDLVELGDDPRPTAVLPRLVVVVDEFATLAAELPGFLSSLVGVAQRGRSLGVHLVLATQRPAGVVSEDIRANTALRVGLRMQDRHDSRDVIGDERAADLPRDVPGRAVVRFGPGEMVTMQVASVSGPLRPAGGVGVDRRRPGARELPATGWLVPPPIAGPATSQPARPVAGAAAARGFADLVADGAAARGPAPGPTDLARLVAVASAGAARLGIGPARQPWPAPLPTSLSLDDLADAGKSDGGDADRAADDGLVEFLLVDNPDGQAQYPGGWRTRGGNLLVAGAVGSGTTTTVGTVAVALARRWPPDRLHLYGLDAAGGELDILGGLPHCGAVVRLGDGEGMARLIGWLAAELDRRRGLSPTDRHRQAEIVLFVDGWSALQAELDGPAGLEQVGQLTRVVLDGPSVGLRTVIGADRPGAVRHQLAATIAQRIVLRLADPYEQHALGPPLTGEVVPGRGVDQATGLVVQIARPGPDGLAAAVARAGARWPIDVERSSRPFRIGRLPTDVRTSELLEPTPAPAGMVADSGRSAWLLPLGIGSADLRPVGLHIHPGEHVLVAGPARSGRSTTLRLVAEMTRRTRPGAAVVGVAPARSSLGRAPLDHCLRPRELARLERLVGNGPIVVLVDDAESVDDVDGLLGRLADGAGFGAGTEADGGMDDLCLVAAGRSDALRTQYGTWVRRVRASRLGVLLQPDVDLDGDLLGVRLPRRTSTPPGPGRGWLAEAGRVELVQLARPDGSAEGGAADPLASAA